MPIRLLALVSLVAAFACEKDAGKAARGAENDGWHEVRGEKASFRFELPAKAAPPRVNTIEGAVLTTYQVKDESDDFWQVQTMPLPPFLTEMDEAALNAGFDTAVGNMLMAMNANKVSDKRIEVHGMPAIEARGTGFNQDREFRVITRMMVSKKRNMLYQMLALRPGGEPDAEKAKIFFDSFRLLD